MKNNEKKLTGYPSIDKPQSIDATFFEKNPIIPSLDIVSLLKILSRNTRNNPAIDCNDLKATYQDLLDDAHMVYLALRELNVHKGDIVCVLLPSNYQAIVSFLAINELGAVATFLDNYSKNEDVVSYLQKYNSPILINYNKSQGENEFYKAMTDVRYIITVYENNVNSRDICMEGHLDLEDVFLDFHKLGNIAKNSKDTFHFPNKKSSEALILYTSGSTGDPKSVVLTNENIIAAQMYAGNTSHTENITGKKQ